MAAAVEVADVGLAGDGDHGLLVIITILGVGGIRSGIGFLLVAGRGSGGDDQESGNDKLGEKRKAISFDFMNSINCKNEIQRVRFVTSFMVRIASVGLLKN